MCASLDAFIGIEWLMHSTWDIAHHLYGSPIWPFMPTSSFGCMIFDAVIAIWFIAGAHPIWRRKRTVEMNFAEPCGFGKPE